MGLQSIEIGGTTVYRNGSRGSHVGVGGPWPALDQEYLGIMGKKDGSCAPRSEGRPRVVSEQRGGEIVCRSLFGGYWADATGI